jgi:hypothetical protein
MKGIIGVATKAVEGAKGWIWTIFYSLMAFSVVTVFLGGGGAGTLAAFVIVVGVEIILRLRKKKAGRFGQVARGSEVEDHSNTK